MAENQYKNRDRKHGCYLSMKQDNKEAEMDRPYFEPQVGSNYRNGGIFGKRILVLGDIHYCNGSKNCAD